MKAINKAVFILLFIINCASMLCAQDSAKTIAIKNAIINKHYSFEAQSVFPQSGNFRQLTPGYYDVQIRNDSIISYLPYYGRAFSAPINPDDGGIKFTSVKFDYNMQPRKKGGWSIIIKLKDAANVQELDFIISEDGYTSLSVASNDKETISFNGYIK
jgi:hypothetical protein